MLPTKLNPLGVNPYDGVMEFEKAGNLCTEEEYSGEYVYTGAQTVTETDDYYEITDIPDGTGHNGRGFNIKNMYLNPNTKYSISLDIENIKVDDANLTTGISVAIYYSDRKLGNFCTEPKNSVIKGSKELGRRTVTGTFTTESAMPENTACKVYVRCEFNGAPTTETIFRVYKNTVMVVKGDVIPTEYEPYNANLYRCYGESTQYKNDGRNLLNPNYLGGSKTSNGVTFSYIPEEDVFCLNGTAGNASQSTQFLTWYPYTLKLDKTSPYRLSIQIVSGEASFVDDTGARVFYLGNGDEPKTSNNWINIDIRKTGSDTNSIIRKPLYDYLTRIWIYQIKPGDSFDNYKFRVQLEKGSSVKDYMPYTDSPTPTPDNPSPIISNYPKGRYKTNLPGITIKLDDDLRSARKASSDYAKDYIEVDISTKEKSIVRECNKYIVTGVESLEFYSPGTSNYTAVLVKFLTKGVIYNQESKITNTFGADIRWSNVNCNLIQIKGIVGAETKDAFAQFMQEKYQQGEPLEVIYALAEPITTQL